ncbi:TIM barrel protein [Phaeacidiphilus oryzae]|uniref:TIM barrel protein n=1 Tax=Phaeacidiphilus oryzae TaxID=348818 RepID=UPI000562BA08|nr:TIM barrel protein [Phaeacidiphilus oryzae]
MEPSKDQLDRRWTVNLSILLTDLPLLERPAAAAAAGFTAAELWWPFGADHVPDEKEVDALRRAFTDAGVRLTGLNFLDGLTEGEKGVLSLPEQSRRFRENIPVAAELAGSLGCGALNALYGNRLAGAAPEAQDELALENLSLAAQAAAGIGAVLLVEALNKVEAPDYALLSADAAVSVVDRVNAATGLGNARFLCDLYHLARNGERLSGEDGVIRRFGDRIGHVQIADTPGRGAPGSGELDLPALLAELDAVGYGGNVGLEYKSPAASAFDWLPRASRANG